MTPKRRRVRLILLVVLVAIPAVFVGTAVVRRHLAARRLAAVIAEIDRTDPHWRLDDLERARAKVADNENFAVALDAAFGKLARPAQTLTQGLATADSHPPSNVRLTPEHEAAARALLATNAAALPDVLVLADYPRGRHAITYSPDAVSTLLRHVDRMTLVNGWAIDSLELLAIHDGDVSRALRMFRARLNCGRSLQDEPILISQLVRGGHRGRAVRGLERLLGHTTLTAAQLAEVRRELEVELADDPWPVAIRGERAMADRTMDALRTGSVKTSYLKALSIQSYQPTVQERVGDWIKDHIAIEVLPAHAFALEVLTRAVATEKLPWPERLAAMESLDAELRSGPEPAQWLATIDLTKRCRWMMAGQAVLRTAIAAVAVEEYRARTGDWPKSLAAVGVALPDDPFTGKPLLLKRLTDGVAVYSVGPNGRDDGGALMDYYERRPEDYDIGFRLWDVPKRNQSPGDRP
ncbi:MAG: hypothetical protein U0746_19895 [Gemmataceae bacterium]